MSQLDNSKRFCVYNMQVRIEDAEMFLSCIDSFECNSYRFLGNPQRYYGLTYRSYEYMLRLTEEELMVLRLTLPPTMMYEKNANHATWSLENNERL